MSDINDRKTEAALRESEERLRLALDAAQLGLWTWDVATNLLTWTPWVYRLLEIPETTEPTYDTFLGSLHPDDRARMEVAVNEALISRQDYSEEFRILLPGGRERWVAASGRAEHDASGRPVKLRGAARDITTRKHAEEALRHAESTLRSIMDSSTDNVILLDLDANIVFINRTAPGLTVDQVTGTSIYGYVAERFRPAMRECFAQVATTGRPDSYVTDYTAPGGIVMTYEAHVAPVRSGDRVTGFAVAARDVTERQQSERALREAERRKAAILETAPDCIVTIDDQSRILDWNPAAERTFGYSAREALGQPMHELIVPPALRERHLQGMARYLTTGEGPILGKRIEIPALRADGTEFVAELAVTVISEGETPVFTAYLRDVTERTQAAETLRRREESFRMLLEHASDLITVITNQGVVRYQSPSIRRVLGYEPEAFVGRNVFEFIHPDDEHVAVSGIQRALTRPGTPNPVQFRMKHQDGHWRLLESIGRSVPGEAEEGFIVVNSRDITESQQLEERLLQSQKMDAIGQLAGGVAHDFNNILTVLLGNADLAAAGEHLTAEVQESLQEIRAAALRASGLTRQLLLFSRRQVMQPRHLDLNDVVSGLGKMLRRIIREDVELQLHLHPAALAFRADPGMIEQVLLNMAVNARDAMPEGGRLLIETDDEDVDETRARPHPGAKPGRHVCLRVTDTGHGIPHDVQPHIFEPFYTTKDVGKGTGLGLATVFGIVEQHKGWIEVTSEPGRGAQFRVFLPADQTPHEAPRNGDAGPTPRGGTETILLIEDEASVRHLAEKMLTRQGYTVLTAANGPEALTCWRQHADRVALVVTDLVMPGGMTGHQLADLLIEEAPELKLVFLSGYSTEIAGREFELRSGENFLQKPFTSSQLLEAVRQALDR